MHTAWKKLSVVRQPSLPQRAYRGQRRRKAPKSAAAIVKGDNGELRREVSPVEARGRGVLPRTIMNKSNSDVRFQLFLGPYLDALYWLKYSISSNINKQFGVIT